MHVLFLNYYYDPDLRDEEDLLERYASSLHWCSAVKAAGAKRVTMLQRFLRSSSLQRNGVDCRFVADGENHSLAFYDRPKEIAREISRLTPDLIHANGRIQVMRNLRAGISQQTAVLWQHHGGPLPRPWNRRVFRRAFRAVDGVLFTSQEQGAEWKAAGCLPSSMPVYDVVESSTMMRPLASREARHMLGFRDETVILWVGRLDANKDPLTCIRGFARVARLNPELRLLMLFGAADLFEQVREEVAALAVGTLVTLVGSVSHRDMARYYSAADYFLLGSHNEGSGFALLEAIACGVTPLVTDIPAFRAITGQGTIGALWKPGDTSSLAQVLSRSLERIPDRTRVSRYFDEHLSFSCLGKRALSIYSMAVAGRSGCR